MEQHNEQTQNEAPQEISAFGRNYTFQGIIDDEKEMAKTVENWKDAGHCTMVKKGNRLYASQLRTRSY